MQAAGREPREPEHQRTAPGCRQRTLPRRAYHLAMVGVGHDQTLRGRQHPDRKARRHREIERVGVRQIMLPLGIGLEIAPAALDLHRHQPAVAAERQEIEPSSVGQRHLVERAHAEIREKPHRSATYARGHVADAMGGGKAFHKAFLKERAASVPAMVRQLPAAAREQVAIEMTGARVQDDRVGGAVRRRQIERTTDGGLGPDDVEALRGGRSAVARAQVAAKLGRQFDALSQGGERELAQAVLLLLVRDVEKEVRRSLAEAIAGSVELPPEVASRLARDEIEVARPVLERSPVLKDGELEDIVRTNAMQYALAVAAREHLSTMLADALVETGQQPVVARVVGNDGAQLSGRALQRVLDDFQADREVQSRLVRRPELPYELVEQLVEVVGERLEWVLMRDGRVSRDAVQNLMRAVRERSTIDLVAREHGERGVAAHLRERFRVGDLGHEELLGFLRDGDVARLEIGLALHVDMPVARLRKLLYQSDRRHLAALCVRAGFATPHYLMLRMAIDLAENTVAKGDRGGYAPDTLRFLQTQYERLRADPAQVESLLGHAGASEG